MFYCFLLVIENTYLTTMPVPVCKIIFGENDPYPGGTIRIPLSVNESSVSKVCYYKAYRLAYQVD
jgi:hypothetical protein